MANFNDAFWKPPKLSSGEYDWWVKQMRTHVCSVDAQLWKIIKQGDLPIKNTTDPTKEKDEKDYTDADYKLLEKNSRAMRVLHSALSPGDMKKILSYKTAQATWEALERLYGGNDDIKKNRILTASRDYETILQQKDESLEEYHTRFQTCVAQMQFLEEEIPEWKVTHRFLQTLNSKWDSVGLALQTQSNFKSITLEELVAKLQSHASIVECREAQRLPQRTHSIALKIEKAKSLALTNKSTDDEDEEIALMTKAFREVNTKGRLSSGSGQQGRRNFNSGGTRRPTSSGNQDNETAPKATADSTCHHCQKKGHFSRDCHSKKRGDPPVPKPTHAMIAAWGESDEDSDEGITKKEPCLMANSTSSQVSLPNSDETQIYSSANYAGLIAKLMRENEELTKEIEELEIILNEKDELIEAHVEENQLWAEKAMRLEREADEHVCRCLTCEGREIQINELVDEIARLGTQNTKLVDLQEKAETLSIESVKLKEAQEETLIEEVTPMKVCECTCNEKIGKSSKQIGQTNETSMWKDYPTEDSVPFEARKAYHIWRKQKTSSRTPR